MSDQFSDELERMRARTERALRDAFVGCTEEIQASITGDPLGAEPAMQPLESTNHRGYPHPMTGAPGQPVQTGQLKGSWIPSLASAWTWQTVTNTVYAESIESGVSRRGTDIAFKSPVGGAHSVLLTKNGWPVIVEHMARRHGIGIKAV